mgnify:CR=1 FL=1
MIASGTSKYMLWIVLYFASIWSLTLFFVGSASLASPSILSIALSIIFYVWTTFLMSEFLYINFWTPTSSEFLIISYLDVLPTELFLPPLFLLFPLLLPLWLGTYRETNFCSCLGDRVLSLWISMLSWRVAFLGLTVTLSDMPLLPVFTNSFWILLVSFFSFCFLVKS